MGATTFSELRSSRWVSSLVLRLCTLLVLVVLAQAAFAQNQQQLERRRKELASQIATTSKLLETSAKDKEAALDRLYGLQRQIVQREEMINVVRQQVTHADSSMIRTQQVMASMEVDISTLTDEYGKMARAALRQGLLNNRLAYLFSAESINDAFVRAQYLRRYDETRRRQLELIASTRTSLARKMSRLEELSLERGSLLSEELTQQQLREGELASKNTLIRELDGSRSKLKSELEQQLRDRESLDDAIANVIAEARATAERRSKERAAAAAAEAERKKAAAAQAERKRAADLAAAAKKTPAPSAVNAPAPAPATTKPALPPAPVSSADYTAELNAEFATNRGKLPWPVEKGYVSKPFGRQPHPTLKRVEINNKGVDIRTDPGAIVRCVFEGEVVGLQSVPGYHIMIVVQHGDYYTVYSNLTDIRVKQGARVGTQDILGVAAIDGETQTSEVHFEVWREKATQDPRAWVRGLR